MVLSRTAVKRHLEVACVRFARIARLSSWDAPRGSSAGDGRAHTHGIRATPGTAEEGFARREEQGEAFRMEIDAHREDIAQQLERRRKDAMETLTRKEESVRACVETAKEEDAKARKVLAGKVDVLKRAMSGPVEHVQRPAARYVH